MADPDDLLPSADAARLRSGTAARLAGLPVTTLRVWERRYGVVAAPKTATGQRLYSPHDVHRLRLLKQLTAQGHAIGTVASLGLDLLQSLAAGEVANAALAAPAEASAASDAVVVVGRAAAHKLQTAMRRPVQAVYDALEDAEAAAVPDGQVDVLLAQLPSLQPASAERVLALAARLQVRSLVVVYGFGAEAVADTLRAAGAAVQREPASGRDLARWIAAASAPRPTARAAPAPAPPGVLQAAPRRYSDEALAQLAEMPSPVACECPRHLAEIVVQLAGFERYSAECGVRSPSDAALHRHLSALAATARTMFEEALTRVMAEEGLELAPTTAKG